jgi:hypothetical protein
MGNLDKLIAAVAGDAAPPTFNAFADLFEAAVGMKPSYVDGWAAYRGSLDAARRLHDALLPGWVWNVVDSETTVWPGYPGDPEDYQTGYAEGKPARAWLLAILRALKTREAANAG